MRLFSVFLLAVLVSFSACKKDPVLNSVPQPTPVVDSTFLTFTSSELFNNRFNYMRETQDFTYVPLDSPKNYLYVYTETTDTVDSARKLYTVVLAFESHRNSDTARNVSFSIPWTFNSLGPYTGERAAIILRYPSGDTGSIWAATGGSANITEFGGGRIKGNFSATLTNEYQSGKTIELTKGTFNVKYKF